MATAQTTLVDALKTPEIYPHPCTSVELVETHLSWVLLTGLRAYKIKKPVDLGFVDFTILERRKRFCEEEIRLNRRLAPDLYLDVVPITGSPEAPQIDGDGPIIEYAVRMKQFERSRALNTASLMKIGVKEIESLADDCAAFHDSAASVASDLHFGTPPEVLRAVIANFEVLCHSDSSICDSVADLRERAEFQFGRLIHTFNERNRDGRVRECHGDLHLGNMFLQDGGITVFDGIEFNESLRWIDVASDIAFLIMDLTAYGHRDLANRFLNRWLERTGDYDALKVLSFYCAYRAAVRAKVDVIRIHQPDVGYSDQRHLVHNCGEYLKLAQRFLIRHLPSLTITMGMSGSGKTTVTDRLLENGNMIRIRSDVERKRMHGLSLLKASNDELKARMYSEQSTRAVYDRLKQLATTVIDSGYPVVVDATFLKRAERQQFARLAESLGVPFTIIHCQANENVLRERIRKRQAEGADASDADEFVLDAQLQTQESPCDIEAQYTVNFPEEVHGSVFETMTQNVDRILSGRT